MQPALYPCNVDVLILCGGKGERLRQVVRDRPKPLADVSGQPFVDIIVDFVAKFGFRRFILLAGYMGEMMQAYAERKAGLSSLDVDCIVERIPLGTGGAIKNAEEFIRSSSFLVLNGDSLCPADLLSFWMFHIQKNALATIMLSMAEDTGEYGQVILDERGRVISFREKVVGGSKGLVNAGVYLFQRKLLDLLAAGVPCSLENDIFPAMEQNSMFGYVAQGPHLDIGTPERYHKAKVVLESIDRNKHMRGFLDECSE